MCIRDRLYTLWRDAHRRSGAARYTRGGGLVSATIRATEKRTVAPERFDPAGATVTSCPALLRGGVHLAHSVGAGPEGVKVKR